MLPARSTETISYMATGLGPAYTNGKANPGCGQILDKDLEYILSSIATSVRDDKKSKYASDD